MNVTGIIMECNPFHEGHAYLLTEARKKNRADYLIAVMSGDFVQRGEPAVFDKYARAQQILRAGADLVLELPLYSACGSAEFFARGGISLLDKLGVVTDLCFGTEQNDESSLLQSAAKLLAIGKDPVRAESFRKKLQEGLRSGLSYPAARAAAFADPVLPGAETDPGSPLPSPGPLSLPPSGQLPMQSPGQGSLSFSGQLPSAPNDLLGLEYCRALLESGSSIRPHAIPRIDVPSATSRRRRLLRDRQDLTCGDLRNDQAHRRTGESGTDIPSPRSDALPGIGEIHNSVPLFPLGPDDFSAPLLYALRMEEDRLDRFADVSTDLGDRIRSLLPEYKGFSSFCDLVKTRNVTRTRVSRVLLHILLRMEKERLSALSADGFVYYARPLAMRRSAAPLLRAIHARSAIPFLAKLSAAPNLLNEKAMRCLREELRAEDYYTHVLFAHSQMYLNGTSGLKNAPEKNLSGSGQDGLAESPAREWTGPVPGAFSRRLIVE